jgi:acetolactate synthase-1/3 small subunit
LRRLLAPRYRAARAGWRECSKGCCTDLVFEERCQGPAVTAAGAEEREGRTKMKHVIAVLMENEPGALSRVVALFSARGYNIESLTVAPTEDPSLSRMTVVTTGSDEVIEQITKHLNRLIDVVKVVDLTEGNFTERELMLIKVRAVGKERDEMKRMADIFRGRIIDVTDKSYTIELTGDAAKLDAFIDAVDRAAILETVRTGTSGIGRGERILRV